MIWLVMMVVYREHITLLFGRNNFVLKGWTGSNVVFCPYYILSIQWAMTGSLSMLTGPLMIPFITEHFFLFNLSNFTSPTTHLFSIQLKKNHVLKGCVMVVIDVMIMYSIFSLIYRPVWNLKNIFEIYVTPILIYFCIKRRSFYWKQWDKYTWFFIMHVDFSNEHSDLTYKIIFWWHIVVYNAYRHVTWCIYRMCAKYSFN